MALYYNINCLPNPNRKDNHFTISQKLNYDCHYIFSRSLLWSSFGRGVFG